MKVGISAIAAYVPRLYLDLEGEWAETRAVGAAACARLRSKVAQGIGIRRMAIPDFHEDSVTLAANAVRRLIDRSGIDPREIASLSLGTESTVDQSKSGAAYVLGLLQRHYGVDLSHVGCPQVQFACIGGTYALEAALCALRAGTSAGKYHVVVASDVARYPLGSAGEPTQGAGAVALLVSAEPKLLEIDLGTIGTCTLDERDFFRPAFLKTAVVDGKRSIAAYCDSVERALLHCLRRGGMSGRGFDDLAACLFHLPFPKMAEYAAARLFRTLWRSEGSYASVLREVAGESVAAEELSLRRHAVFKERFARLVAPSLGFGEQIGNVYSASLTLALLSFLDQAGRDGGGELDGREILLASFGSGASAKVLRGRFAAGALTAPVGNLAEDLRDSAAGGPRVRISLEQYERLHRHVDCRSAAAPVPFVPVVAPLEGVEVIQPPPSIVAPEDEFYLKALGTTATPEASDFGYRYYDFAGRR